MPFFLPKGAFVYNRMVELRARPLRARGLRRGHHAAGLRPEALSHERPPRPTTTRTCTGSGPRTSSRATGAPSRGGKLREKLQEGALRPQADELPEPLRHLRLATAQLPRAALARGRLRAPPPLRARRRGARPRARAAFCAGRRAHLLRRGAGRRRDRGVHAASSTRVYKAFGFEKIDIKLATRPEKRLGTDEDWDRAETRARRGARAGRAGVRGARPAKGPSTARRSSSTSRTRSSARWQLGTHPVRPEPAGALRPRVHRRGRQGAPAGDAPPRDLRLARALLRRLPRALRRELPGLARAASRRSSSP